MISNFLAFWPDYYLHIRATSLLSLPNLPIETIAIRIKEDIIPQKIIKRDSKKDMTDFLQILNKLFSKKKKQKNKSKQKASIGETSSRKAIISSLKNFDKKKLLIFIPATKILKLKAKNIDIAMIGTNAYCIAYYLKEIQLLAVLIKNIQYQAKKKNKIETDFKSIVP